jgi:hypothetical protein
MKITDQLIIKGVFFNEDDERSAFSENVELRKYNCCVLSYTISSNAIHIKTGFKYNLTEGALYSVNDIVYNNFKLNSPMDYIQLIKCLESYGVPIENVRSFVNNTLQIAQAAQVLSHYKIYLQDAV